MERIITHPGFENLLWDLRKRKVQDIFLIENDKIHVRYLGEIESTGMECPPTYLDILERYFRKDKVEEEHKIAEDVDSYTIGEQDFTYESTNGERYRINMFRSLGRRKSVIRIINDYIPDLDTLGVDMTLPRRIIENKGLSIIAGKTCSGKTTTMAGIIKMILETVPWHIITLEDPAEYRFPSGKGLVTQRELHRDFRSYEEGIVSSLRQSPDLILIGEIRDRETLKAAVTAAETGAGVIATLHSKGARNTLLRMTSMFPESEKRLFSFQLAGYLNFIQSQVLHKGEGRMELDYELFLNTPAVANSIREDNLTNLENIILMGRKSGMKQFTRG